MSANMNELEIEKIHAEIVELRQRVNESIARQTKFNVETDKMKNETESLDESIKTEINKIIAETAKINSENKWYPAIIASTATLAIVAIVKLFL